MHFLAEKCCFQGRAQGRNLQEVTGGFQGSRTKECYPTFTRQRVRDLSDFSGFSGDSLPGAPFCTSWSYKLWRILMRIRISGQMCCCPISWAFLEGFISECNRSFGGGVLYMRETGTICKIVALTWKPLGKKQVLKRSRPKYSQMLCLVVFRHDKCQSRSTELFWAQKMHNFWKVWVKTPIWQMAPVSRLYNPSPSGGDTGRRVKANWRFCRETAHILAILRAFLRF